RLPPCASTALIGYPRWKAASTAGVRRGCPSRNPDASPEEPMPQVTMYCTAVCPYCIRAEALLRQRGVADIHKIHIDRDPAQRAVMMERTGRRTVPQI